MKEVTRCRACHGTDLIEFLNLGEMPLANAFVKPQDLAKPENRYPLSVRRCAACGMAQLGHAVPAEEMFTDYPFFTGTSARMAEHYSTMMNTLVDRHVPPYGTVVEIGSNDCTALKSIRRTDLYCVGVDPALTMPVHGAAVAHQIAALFTESLVKDFILPLRGQASLIVACNVLGHVDDLDDFLRGVQRLLAKDGAFVFEVPYHPDGMYFGDYGQYYHEHCSYFTVSALDIACSRAGLQIVDVERYSVHGGSIRCTVRHKTERSTTILDSGACLSDAFYRDFVSRVSASRERLVDKLKRYDGKVMGYCASAKGTVILNYCGIGLKLVPTVLDNTPAKQVLHVPGTHQFILDRESASLNYHKAILVLSMNHMDEIRAKHPNYKGEWINPYNP